MMYHALRSILEDRMYNFISVVLSTFLPISWNVFTQINTIFELVIQ